MADPSPVDPRSWPTPINHLAIQCEDVHATAAFYEAVLPAVGASRAMARGETIGYGIDGVPSFWIGPLAGPRPNREVHIAFSAPTREAVRDFHERALATGATSLHEPRVWPEYHPNYYGAFVRDPDGNNVEAVCHAAP